MCDCGVLILDFFCVMNVVVCVVRVRVVCGVAVYFVFLVVSIICF